MSGCRGRDQFEAFGSVDGDVVQSDGGEIGEQSVEAVHGYLFRRGALRPGGLRIVLVEQDRGQPLPHVPFGVVGEHAQEHVIADTGFAVNEDWPDSQPPGFDLPEGLLDARQASACLHRLVRPDTVRIKAGADDPETVELRFAVDPFLAAAPEEIVVFASDLEVLGDLEAADGFADAPDDHLLAAKARPLPSDDLRDPLEPVLRGLGVEPRPAYAAKSEMRKNNPCP